MSGQAILDRAMQQAGADVIVSCYMPGDPTPAPMDAQEWARVRDILHGALSLAMEQRPAYLDQACAGDAALRGEVESLLAASDRSAFIDRPLMPPVDVLAVGRRIAHYQVVEKIGEGGMGAVYKAMDTRLDRPVALKVMARGAGTRIHERRFAREARAASALNHPNIVTIYGFDTHEGLDFIAMEYVQGTTFSKLLELRELSQERLLDYARQAAGAIAKAHRAGIVHRDLKPGNIMVTHDGIVKVLDFGLARQQAGASDQAITQTALTLAGTVAGTPAYMSPEQAKGQREDWRTDIFSFGVILYEIVCGRRPFEGNNAHATMYQIANEEPPAPALLNPAVPAALVALIVTCLKKDRADRTQSMDEVAAALAELGGARPEPRPELRPEPRSMLRPVSRRVMVAAGAVGAVAIATTVWLSQTPERVISYGLEAQKMQGGGEVSAPYAASPADTFEGGWRFRLRVRPAQSGYLYLINEGPGDSGASRFWVLYPVGASSAALAANSQTATGWQVFDQNPGTEKVWIVWSEQSLPAMEDTLGSGTQGEVKDPALAARIRSLLEGMKRPAPLAGSGPASGVQLRAAEGVLGSLMELRHR